MTASHKTLMGHWPKISMRMKLNIHSWYHDNNFSIDEIRISTGLEEETIQQILYSTYKSINGH